MSRQYNKCAIKITRADLRSHRPLVRAEHCISSSVAKRDDRLAPELASSIGRLRLPGDPDLMRVSHFHLQLVPEDRVHEQVVLVVQDKPQPVRPGGVDSQPLEPHPPVLDVARHRRVGRRRMRPLVAADASFGANRDVRPRRRFLDGNRHAPEERGLQRPASPVEDGQTRLCVERLPSPRAGRLDRHFETDVPGERAPQAGYEDGKQHR